MDDADEDDKMRTLEQFRRLEEAAMLDSEQRLFAAEWGGQLEMRPA